MGLFDGLLGGGGGGGIDYAGLLSGSGNIDYNKLLQQELANADNAKWGALAGALAEAGMPSRLPIPIGSAIGKAAAAFSGSDNNSLLKILQIQKLATETQSLKELSELRKSLPADMKGLLDDIVKVGGAPGAGQPNVPAGDGAPGAGTPTGGGGGGGTLTGEAIPIGQPGNPGSLAMEHPPEVQEQVAKKIATTSGLQHWAGEWNPKLQADLRAAGLPLSGPVSEEQWNAAKPLILARESMGGKNVPNYRFDATHTAGGPFQITNSTFRAFGGPDIAAAANAAASGKPLPSAFNLPKFSGLLGESTDAEQPSIQAAGVPLMSLPSQQEIGPPPNRARASPEAMRRAWPTGPGSPPLPPELGGPAPARTSMYPPPTPGQLATLAAMGGGDTMGGGNTEGALPGDLVTQMTPGQGPLAIPRPAGLPPMPAAPVAPPGGLLAPPQASAAPPAGPGLLAPPQAPVAAPAAPPAVRPGPSYMPQMPAGMNEQQMLQLQARVAQLRAKAALGGITGDPFAGYADLLKNSPNAQRLAEIIKQQAEYYGPNANPALKGALTTAEEQSRTPEINKRETYKTDEQIRLEGQKAALNEQLDAWKQGRAAQFDFQPVTVKNPETNRLETRLIPKADYARSFNPNAGLPGVPAAPITPQGGPAAGAPPASGGPLGNNIVGTPVYPPGTEDMAKNAATAFGTAQQAETAANKHTQVLGQMAEAMKGFQPGASAELRYNGQRILKDLGFIQGNEVPSAETFQKAAAYLQFASVPKAQGSYSNTEREMFAPSIPRMVDSPEGLVKAINISLRLNDYDRQVAQIWRESVSATGVPDYAQAQERIAKLGPPLSPGEVAALQDIKEGRKPGQSNTAGIPEGAKPVGTYQGKPVYQMLDGSRKVMQ